MELCGQRLTPQIGMPHFAPVRGAGQVRDGSAFGAGGSGSSRTFASGSNIGVDVSLGMRTKLWGSCRFGGDGSEGFCRIEVGRPVSEASSGVSPPTGPSGCGGLPAATAAVSPGMGRAPGPHIPAAGPRRAQDRQAPPHGRHGLAVRPANPRGSHLLGLGPGHRLDPQHPGPSGTAGPDRPRVVHAGPAVPVRGGEPSGGGRVSARPPGQAAPP
jgi:hypothetical protein